MSILEEQISEIRLIDILKNINLLQKVDVNKEIKLPNNKTMKYYEYLDINVLIFHLFNSNVISEVYMTMKRISLMVRDDQYKSIVDSGLNLSGLVRDLIDDHLSEYKITLSVTEETRQLYDLIVSNTGSTDEDVEKYLKDTLKLLLKDRIKAMQDLEKEIFNK